MVAAFDIDDVNPNPARFDLKKAEAINAAHMRLLSTDEIDRTGSCRSSRRAGVVGDPVTDAERAAARAARCRWSHERINKLTEAVDMLGFLFVDEADFTRDEADAAKLLDDGRPRVVAAAHDALAALDALDDRGDRGGAAGRAGRRSSASSRATPSARSGSPSPAAGSRRRSSSPSSCSAASEASAGWRRLAEAPA